MKEKKLSGKRRNSSRRSTRASKKSNMSSTYKRDLGNKWCYVGPLLQQSPLHQQLASKQLIVDDGDENITITERILVCSAVLLFSFIGPCQQENPSNMPYIKILLTSITHLHPNAQIRQGVDVTATHKNIRRGDTNMRSDDGELEDLNETELLS